MLRQTGDLNSIGRLSRDTFVESVDDAVASDGDADVIWRRARRTRHIVVLLDDLDGSPAFARDTRDERDVSGIRAGRAARRRDQRRADDLAEPAADRFAPIRLNLDALEGKAREYVLSRIAEIAGRALDALPERVLDSLMDVIRTPGGEFHASAMFHLARIAELEARDRLREPLPRELEQRRTELLVRWLEAVADNDIDRDRLSFGQPDAATEKARRRAALGVAGQLGQRLLDGPARTGLRRSSLDGDPGAVDDAIVLGLRSNITTS